MATDRTAHVTWNGSLMDGSGTITETTSGAIGHQAVSWAARSEDQPGGKTSPEELIAAAHASCFSMALSHGLAQDGNPPEELQTSATVTVQPGEGITKVALSVVGRVPGVDRDLGNARERLGNRAVLLRTVGSGAEAVLVDAGNAADDAERDLGDALAGLEGDRRRGLELLRRVAPLGETG